MATRPIIYSGQGFSLRGEKGRFVLPSQFRKTVRESSDDQRTLYLGKHDRWNCLVGYGESRRTDLFNQLERQRTAAEDRGEDFDYDTKASLIFGCTETPFDDSGRFVVPAGLLRPAKVDDQLFFQGGGAFFTLWNPAELDKMGPEWDAPKSMCASLAEEAAIGRGRKP